MAEPSKKKVKTDPGTVAVKSEGDDEQQQTVTVEFKFCSCKTKLFNEGEMTGTLHVPMLQDPETGRFRIPVGTTHAQGKVKFAYV